MSRATVTGLASDQRLAREGLEVTPALNDRPASFLLALATLSVSPLLQLLQLLRRWRRRRLFQRDTWLLLFLPPPLA